MTTLTIALIVCTALCLAFKESRGLGIAGVLVLILVAPLVLGALLVAAGLVYFFLRRRSRYEVIPRGSVLPSDGASRRRSGFGLLLVAAAVVGVLAFAYAPVEEGGIHEVVQGVTRSAPAEELIVLRSAGGLLQTATIEVEEVLDTTITHRLLGMKIGETTPRVRVRAFYHYHVRLDPEWRVVRRGDVITALAPALTPTLPIAIDTATIETAVAGTWLLVPITGDDDIEALERTITEKLARKATSDEYKRRALEESRKTVQEFIENWAVHSGHRGVTAHVVFDGEVVRSIETITG